MNATNRPGGNEPPTRKTENFIAICDQIM
jgi:hypothetical protein